MTWIDRLRHTEKLYFKVLRPTPALRRHVRYYWILHDNPNTPQIDEYLAPDGFEEIIFSFADGFRRTQILGDQTSERETEGSYLVTCKSAGVRCARLGTLAMIGIKLRPQSLQRFIRMPLQECAHRTIPLRDLGHPGLAQLEQRVFEARDEAHIRAILDEALVAMQLAADRNALVDYVLDEIFGKRGNVTIDDLVRATGRHYRTLEKQFRSIVGLPPKSIAKLIRFKHAFHALSTRDPHQSVLDFGYYDPSHFAKDFKQFTGTTPARFLGARALLSTDVFRFCSGVDLRELRSSGERDFLLEALN